MIGVVITIITRSLTYSWFGNTWQVGDVGGRYNQKWSLVPIREKTLFYCPPTWPPWRHKPVKCIIIPAWRNEPLLTSAESCLCPQRPNRSIDNNKKIMDTRFLSPYSPKHCPQKLASFKIKEWVSQKWIPCTHSIILSWFYKHGTFSIFVYPFSRT